MEKYEEGEVVGQVVGRKVTLRQLNEKAVQKLHELIDSLDAKSEPEMVQACVESLAKLDSALKNSDILEKEESSEERAAREKSNIAEGLLKR